jgi:FtsP/CotA-like multicopper oxidase with cupredoxin domain
LESPHLTKRLRLSPGERAEIVVNLSDGKETLLKSFPEDEVMLLAEAVFADGIGNGHFEILKIIPEPTETESTDLPHTLNKIERWRPKDAVKTRRMVLGGPIREGRPTPGPGPRIPINGKLMDMGRVDEVVRLGDIEIWEIMNRGGQAHPFHIHDVQFLILDRDGTPPEPSESGWKDTVLVGTNETVRFITQFNTYANPDIPYMYHCHILEHEDGGMMGQFLVIDPEAE